MSLPAPGLLRWGPNRVLDATAEIATELARARCVTQRSALFFCFTFVLLHFAHRAADFFFLTPAP